MTISSTGPATLPTRASNSEPQNPEIEIALLKKAQDQMKQQGTALVEMLESIPVAGDPNRLDTYA